MTSNTDKLRLLKNKANKLPLLPGVYIMRDKTGNVIYVGKAKVLKNRVTQYFGNNSNHTVKVRKMVENVDDFETIICDTEYESLMLENSLIKQHQPKYNILLKDDKGYHYIKITSDEWPKVEAVKNKLNDGAEYIGPYYSGNVVNQTVDEALKIFKFPNCKRSFDKKSKPCLNYHIGICSAPCNNNITKHDYFQTISSIRDYVKNGGVNDADIKNLKEQMISASDNLDFELAAKLRDRISAIEKSREKQKVINTLHKRQDVFATALVGDKACVSIFVYKQGNLTDKKVYFLDGLSSKAEYYSQFIQQYYLSCDDIPSEVVLDSCFDEMELLAQWLSSLKGGRVIVTVPQRGAQKQLVGMCLSNSAQELSNKIDRSANETAALNELSQLLGLSSVPRRIESYDISNTSGSNNVGAMVVFIDGRPVKSLYRTFNIKSFVGQDDFKSLNEILDRRFNEYILASDESFKELPDLILLDGGKGQISSVKPLLEKYDLHVQIFGMVKDAKHKTRAITAGGEDIHIKGNHRAFSLVNQIQNEVHRVAISFHHKRAKNNTLQLELTKIDGVGPMTAKKLIKSFRSIKNIRDASIEELCKEGISKKVAENIIEFYK